LNVFIINHKFLQLKLKIIWFENYLGLAVNIIGLKQQYLLTPYYFWPRTNAWEQLKLELDSKFWLTEKEKIDILRTTRNVMDYWLSYRNTKNADNLREDFKEIEVLTLYN
jgi:30S ribosomal protein 3